MKVVGKGSDTYHHKRHRFPCLARNKTSFKKTWQITAVRLYGA